MRPVVAPLPPFPPPLAPCNSTNDTWPRGKNRRGEEGNARTYAHEWAPVWRANIQGVLKSILSRDWEWFFRPSLRITLNSRKLVAIILIIAFLI